MGWGDMDWMNLPQERDRLEAVAKSEMSLQVS
jgi:hypothetical protein